MENSRTMRRIILASNKVLATGYNEIPFAPHVPIQDIPTKAECQGYQFISMVQLCKIATEHNWSLHTACRHSAGIMADIRLFQNAKLGKLRIIISLGSLYCSVQWKPISPKLALICRYWIMDLTTHWKYRIWAYECGTMAIHLFEHKTCETFDV